MKNLVLASIIGMLSCSVMAASPNDVVRGAADSLLAAIDGRKDELSAIGMRCSPWPIKFYCQISTGIMRRKYGEGVLQFDQGSLEILPFRGDDTKPRVTVKTIVRLDDGTKVPINYGLVNRDIGWMMFDVTFEGISYVRNYRTEINAEI